MSERWRHDESETTREREKEGEGEMRTSEGEKYCTDCTYSLYRLHTVQIMRSAYENMNWIDNVRV